MENNMTHTKKSIAYIKNGVLHVRRRKQSEWILLLVMLWPFLINLISDLPSPLNYMRYLCDGIMLCWLLAGFTKKALTVQRDNIGLFLWVGSFLVYTFAAYMINYQSLLYYLWGIRMNFRGYILFLHVLLQVRKTDADEWLGFLDTLFWINAVLAVFQFFVGGVGQDLLGGIFGSKEETNGYTLIFLSIVVVKSQFKFYEHEETLWAYLLKCAAALLIGAMAELKFYLLLFIFQMMLAAVLTKFSWKKVLVLAFGAIAASFSMELLTQWFSASGSFEIEKILEKAFQENYATANDLNRLSAIGTLRRKIVSNPLDRLIGLGLGNCDSANFALLRTPFYERYSYLHYTFFLAPTVFLETGYIGLVFFLGFFVICLRKAMKKRKTGEGSMLYNNMGIVFSVTAIVLAFYNASLRYESGWLIYIILALPFISMKQGHDERVNL